MRKNETIFSFLRTTPQGFTLVELMIAVAISGVVIGAIYSAYLSQQRTYVAQEQVAEMQQNIRAALDMITREIRTAGFDPTNTAGADIITALPGQISFTQDFTDNLGTGNSDGDTADAGEMVDFGFSVADDALRDGIPDIDADGDGVPDAISLGKQINGGGYQDIAENIQAIEFRYFDSTEAVTAVPANVRFVQVSILARAGREDREFVNTTTYTPASGVNWGPYNDNFRRRLLITTVQCRNMGL